MRISTRARYGARLMLGLGLHYGNGPLYLKEIARNEDISEKYLSQIIIPLKSMGLVNSQRGAHGGYTLARAPEQIRMDEIISVLEGGIQLVDCVDQPTCCMRVSQCVTRNLWQQVGNSITKTLTGVTLADLVQQCRQKKLNNVTYHI